ncbi:MAG: hypothetical protein C4533_08140 [Candidatus Omnitrophota bacterium]|jgi:hypothetical protein|nr:MAG: hypothetical protein C4533_08140 [Candidatus Omnitrophota bacterium]
MGIIYKLTEQAKNIVLDEKRNNPKLSCRKLVLLLKNKHNLVLSKSSINSIVKEAGLSQSVGRKPAKITPKKVRPSVPTPKEAIVENSAVISEPVPIVIEPPQVKVKESPVLIENAGYVFLKIADDLIGGGRQIASIIASKLNNVTTSDIMSYNNSLLFRAFNATSILTAIQSLSPNEVGLSSYLADLQSVTNITPRLIKALTDAFTRIRGYRLYFSDNSTLFLDSQFRSVWQVPNMPIDFSLSYLNASSYVKSIINHYKNFCIQSGAKDNLIPEEFIDLCIGLSNSGKTLKNISLFSDNLTEIENIAVQQEQQPFTLVAGFWSDQIRGGIKINMVKDFESAFIGELSTQLHIGFADLDVTQLTANKRVKLKGYLIKSSPNDKRFLVIASSNYSEPFDNQGVIVDYLKLWPNYFEGFIDFKRKYEAFTYLPEPAANFNFKDLGPNSDIKATLREYFNGLDFYVRRYILPPDYETESFSTINEHFYSLKAVVMDKTSHFQLKFQVPDGYKFTSVVRYACRRANERSAMFADGKKILLEI